jgi:hypothetical protein
MYNYREAMKDDIRQAIRENINLDDFINDRDGLEEKLNDDLFVDDAVTGNASGSYTFNSYQAGEYVKDNIDLCREALQEFCVEADTIAEKFLDEEWEYFDVTIRCYLLGECISYVLDEMEADGAFDEVESEEIAS